MGKRNRSISIAGDIYDKLKAHCKAQKIPMSQLVEKLVNRQLDIIQYRTF